MKLSLFAIFTVLSSIVVAAPQTQTEVRQIVIEIKDKKFVPDVIEISKSEKVELLVKNLDASAEEFESHDLKKEKVIPAGKSATFKLGNLKAGEYKFFGEFNPKTANGKVIVKE